MHLETQGQAASFLKYVESTKITLKNYSQFTEIQFWMSEFFPRRKYNSIVAVTNKF